jgi:branched-chain amino acid transport system substrate-binding protein
MVYDDKDWAIFGSINSESTHIALRVALRAEIPIVNSASTDPTIAETYIPWYFTTIQDDRAQDQTLARRIYTELGLKRVAMIRASSRYGRFGVTKFMDASRRLGHPVVMEQIFQPGEKDFTRALKLVKNSRADAVVIWGDEQEAAAILKQMRAAGMKQRAFGQFRTLGDTLLAEAGDAAEGFEAVYPYDPTRQDPGWVDFNRRYEARFHEKPEQFASLAYDTMNILLDSICKAGLNRARIHDALANIIDYEGVTGHMHFDPLQKNMAPLYLGTVHNGAITYAQTTTAKKPGASASVIQKSPELPNTTTVPYARVGEEGVSYNGPHDGALPTTEPRMILFGPHASEVARSNELLNQTTGEKEFKLLAVDSDQSWGKASTQLVQALMDEHPLAILALDRNSAHLSMQLALKCFVPVLAISSDKTLTSTNVPWIFRASEGSTVESSLQLLRMAYSQGATTPDSLRTLLASGKSVDGQAFLTTGEPMIH